MTQEALSKFIAHIAATAPEVWLGMVRFHRAEAVTLLFVDLLSAIGIVLVIKKGIQLLRESKSEGPTIVGALLIIIPLLTSLHSLHYIPRHVAQVTYPEREAALDILEQAQKAPK